MLEMSPDVEKPHTWITIRCENKTLTNGNGMIRQVGYHAWRHRYMHKKNTEELAFLSTYEITCLGVMLLTRKNSYITNP